MLSIFDAMERELWEGSYAAQPDAVEREPQEGSYAMLPLLMGKAATWLDSMEGEPMEG